MDNVHQIFNRFITQELLGQGAYGTVYRVFDVQNDTTRALKIVRKNRLSQREYNGTIQEARILQEQSNPYLVQFFEILEGNFNNSECLMILLEYCPILNIIIKHGDLRRNLDTLIEIEAPLDIGTQKRWARQLIAAIKFLARSLIIHRDIKPNNVLVVEDFQPDGIIKYDLKLSDFGLAREFQSTLTQTTTAVGTAKYAAPEIDNLHPYDYKVDVWSTGAVIYEFIVLAPLFQMNADDRNSIERFRNRIKSTNEPLPTINEDHVLRPILDRMLVRNPIERCTAEEIHTELMQLLN